MQEYEVIEIEEKAKAILGSLSQLEKEEKTKQRLNDNIAKALESLQRLTDSLIAATKGIGDSARLLVDSSASETVALIERERESLSTLGKQVEDARKGLEEACAALVVEIDKKTSALTGISADIETLTQLQGKQLSEQGARVAGLDDRLATLIRLQSDRKEIDERRFASLDERMAALEERIGRIDRNTQKGFGKERSDS